MNIAVTAPLDRKRWLAALQSGEEALDSLQAQMDLAEQQLLKAADPKAVYRIMNKADIKREGVSIEKHLAECETADAAETIDANFDHISILHNK